MPGRMVSRRFVMGALASSVAAGPLIAQAAAAASSPRAIALAEALVAPLRPGAPLGRWIVRRVAPMDLGAVTVTLAGADGHEFHVEILARDPSPLAPRPPAATARFAVHVRNGGDGWLPTCEEQGLAAMTLAQVLAANEHAIDAADFLTHAERLARHGAALLPASDAPGAAPSRG